MVTSYMFKILTRYIIISAFIMMNIEPTPRQGQAMEIHMRILALKFGPSTFEAYMSVEDFTLLEMRLYNSFHL